MDYIAGETLDVAFRHLAPAPLDRALPVIAQIADALDAGWAVGLGHGALHPRDVFLSAGHQRRARDRRRRGAGARSPRASKRRCAGRTPRRNGRPTSPGMCARTSTRSARLLTSCLTRRRPAGPGEQDGALATGLTPEQRVHVRRILSAALVGAARVPIRHAKSVWRRAGRRRARRGARCCRPSRRYRDAPDGEIRRTQARAADDAAARGDRAAACRRAELPSSEPCHPCRRRSPENADGDTALAFRQRAAPRAAASRAGARGRPRSHA